MAFELHCKAFVVYGWLAGKTDQSVSLIHGKSCILNRIQQITRKWEADLESPGMIWLYDSKTNLTNMNGRLNPQKPYLTFPFNYFCRLMLSIG